MLSVLCPEIFIATDRGTPARSLFLTVAVPAYSNPPSQAPPKNSENQKTHPAAEEKPAYNPAGTDKQPFVVKSLEAEKTPEHTEQERPEREEKSANERRLIVWNFILQASNPCPSDYSRPPFWDGPIVCVTLTPTDDSFTKVSGKETVLQSFASAGPAVFRWHRLQHDRPDRKNPL